MSLKKYKKFLMVNAVLAIAVQNTGCGKEATKSECVFGCCEKCQLNRNRIHPAPNSKDNAFLVSDLINVDINGSYDFNKKDLQNCLGFKNFVYCQNSIRGIHSEHVDEDYKNGNIYLVKKNTGLSSRPNSFFYINDVLHFALSRYGIDINDYQSRLSLENKNVNFIITYLNPLIADIAESSNDIVMKITRTA